MRSQIEGSKAIAAVVAACRPEVISCYPITPQTHIVETLSAKVKKGEMGATQFLNVESEFAALSVLIGASATGARTYTATASQGLLFMAEAVYNASGLGLPIVMTVGNRAIGAPINIWNDHSDSMALRDAGWIQLFAEDNQEAADLHIQAFRLAEHLSCPVMVCVDGFILTHAFEAIELPEQSKVDAFLPPYDPVQILDPADPVSIGAMVGPEAFTEVRYLVHHKQIEALRVIPELSQAFQKVFQRSSGGLIRSYRTEDAETLVIALGSVMGTIKDTVDKMRDSGFLIGCLKIVSYRPFPATQVRAAIGQAKCVIVLEKDLAVGRGGILASDVKMALEGNPVRVQTVIAGLGGRAITMAALEGVFKATLDDTLSSPYFLDLNWDVVNNELARQRKKRGSGPSPENILREIGNAPKPIF